MRRAFTSDFDSRNEWAPFRGYSDADMDAMPTGAKGASLGWADSVGRPELTPFAESDDLMDDMFDDRASLVGAKGRWGRYEPARRYTPAISFRGRGPRREQRSDESLREAVCECLMEDDYVDPTEVSVEVQDGEVTLEGAVAHRYMKHRIEDLADSIRGVREVHNRLRVASAG